MISVVPQNAATKRRTTNFKLPTKPPYALRQSVNPYAMVTKTVRTNVSSVDASMSTVVVFVHVQDSLVQGMRFVHKASLVSRHVRGKGDVANLIVTPK